MSYGVAEIDKLCRIMNVLSDRFFPFVFTLFMSSSPSSSLMLEEIPFAHVTLAPTPKSKKHKESVSIINIKF